MGESHETQLPVLLLHVADGAEQERDAEHGEREPARAARVLGDLARHDGDGGEHEARDPDGGAEREGVHGVEPGRDEHDAGREGDGRVRDDRRDERRGRGRVPPHDARPDELGPAGLLLGARVPHDEEDAHDRDGDHDGERHLVGDHRAERVVLDAVLRPGQHDPGRARDERRARLAVGRRRVERVEGDRRVPEEERDGRRPHGDADAVAAQDEAQQGEPARRRAAGTRGLGSDGGASSAGRGRGGGAHSAPAPSSWASSSP